MFIVMCQTTYEVKSMVKISPLTKADIKAVVLLEEAFLKETLGEELLESELNSNITKFYVAKIDNKVVGYIGRYAYLDEAEILNFVVDEKYQRKGIGQSLFDQIKKDLPTLKRITLEVRPSNAKAINFYTKNGFQNISIRKNYYQNGEDALVLMKEYL